MTTATAPTTPDIIAALADSPAGREAIARHQRQKAEAALEARRSAVAELAAIREELRQVPDLEARVASAEARVEDALRALRAAQAEAESARADLHTLRSASDSRISSIERRLRSSASPALDELSRELTRMKDEIQGRNWRNWDRPKAVCAVIDAAQARLRAMALEAATPEEVAAELDRLRATIPTI